MTRMTCRKQASGVRRHSGKCDWERRWILWQWWPDVRDSRETEFVKTDTLCIERQASDLSVRALTWYWYWIVLVSVSLLSSCLWAKQIPRCSVQAQEAEQLCYRQNHHCSSACVMICHDMPWYAMICCRMLWRHLGPWQMTTDSAMLYTQKVLEHACPLAEIPGIESPEFERPRDCKRGRCTNMCSMLQNRNSLSVAECWSMLVFLNIYHI